MHNNASAAATKGIFEQPQERFRGIRQEKMHLDRENSHLSTENQMLRQTMRARATSNVNTRHMQSKYPQHDRRKYNEILEGVHNQKAYKMYQGVPMKDLNGNIKKNEGKINYNAHKIKKLDGEYKKNYLAGMKQESNGIWNYFNQTLSSIPPKNCACQHNTFDMNAAGKVA